jgi:hypothetical protein
MVALVVKEPAQVDTVYKKAIELGAKDEARPARAALASTPATSAIPTATSSTCSA